jgi:hypothetical protein
MPITKDKPGSYAPTSAIMGIIERHRRNGLPSPVTEDVLERTGISASLTSRTLQALMTLDLIDDQGRPTPTLEGIRLAPDPEYKERLADWLRAAYADALSFVDPAEDDETKIRDAFRAYKPVGQQPRMVTLFTGLFAAAGVRPEKKRSPAARPANRSPRSSQTAPNGSNLNSGKDSQKAENENQADTHADIANDGHKGRQHHQSGKALEYQLIDLMSEADIDDTVKQSIWALVQYLTARKAKTPKQAAAPRSEAAV